MQLVRLLLWIGLADLKIVKAYDDGSLFNTNAGEKEHINWDSFKNEDRHKNRIYGISNDEDIIRGLAEVGLWSIIERIGGLDMLLADDSLSHGQRQLLRMTLACLQRGKIVLMDEPKSQ